MHIESRENRVAREIESVAADLLAQAKSSKDTITLHLPHALYLTDRQSRLYEAATAKSNAYQDGLDRPIAKLLDQATSTIIGNVGTRAHFIDLGPGYPSKSLSLLDALVAQGTAVTYYAVDISPFFLERAVSAVHQRNLPAHSLHRRFEEIEPILDRDLAPKVPRIIFLGLTFCNFDPSDICEILAGITRSSDRAIICTQSPVSAGDEQVLKPYKADAVKAFAFEVLRVLGVSESFVEYTPTFRNSCIFLEFTVARDFTFRGTNIQKGRKIITARSFRHEIAEIVKIIAGNFSVVTVETDEKSGVNLLVLQGI